MAEHTSNLGTPNSGKGSIGPQSLTSASAGRSGQLAGRTTANDESLKKNIASGRSSRLQDDMDDEETGTNRSSRSSDSGKNSSKR